MSDDEGEVQGRDGEEEGRAAKPARDLGAPTTAEIAKHAVSHWPYGGCLHCIRGRGSSRQHRTDKGRKRTIPVLSADCCSGGEMAAHQSRVLLMVDTETSMVFPHACERKGADSDTVESLMEDIKVLGRRHIVFCSDQDNPVKAERNEIGEEPKVSVSSKRSGGERAARDWVDQGADGRTGVEANFKQLVDSNAPAMTFRVNHAATFVNRFS